MTFELNEIILALYATVIGLIVGVERELKNKPAGLRTLMLVSLGSCIFTMISLQISTESSDRVASNIVTGIGFLGAGAIFRDDNKINGVTTAAIIWITAALGMSVGLGQVQFAFLATAIVIVSLILMSYLEDFIASHRHAWDYSITFLQTEDEAQSKLEELFKTLNLRYKLVGFIRKNDLDTYKWSIKGPSERHSQLIEKLMQHDKIKGLEF